MFQLGGSPAGAPGASDASNGPVLYRWRFNLKTGQTQEGPLDEVACELPRFDERKLGRATRFAYAMDTGMGRLIKYDLATGASSYHDFGAGRAGGEPVFVPRAADAAEDDGWLVTYVFDASEQKSELVVIAARDFSAPPIARVKIPARIPFGFHGTWIDEAKLAAKG
jgi:carotenoid cleavage dioxygenase